MRNRGKRRPPRPLPDKSVPAMGIAAGVVMTCAGLLFLIPSLGAGGVYWTMLALVWTICCAVQLFRTMGGEPEEEADRPVESGPEEAPGPEPEETDPVALRLRDLQELYVARILTREEYDHAVREITEGAEPEEHSEKGMK